MRIVRGMARYETYQSNAAQAPIMRRWVFRALLLSLVLHAGLFVFFKMKRLENFGLGAPETLAPPKFVVNKVTIDPKTLEEPEEIKTTLKDKPKPVKIDVPIEKIEPSEISLKPSNAEIASPILNDKPAAAAVNKDLLAKAEQLSSGARDKELGSIASDLLKESTKSRNQPVVFTLPNGSKEVGGGVGDREGIPGLRSLDDAIAATGPLASGDRLGMRGGALFEYDKADLLQQAIDDLQKLGEIIRRNPKASFIIEGHTDSLGNPEYNMQLSQRRADAVKVWLVANMGIAEERVVTIGFGSSKPIAPITGNINEQAPNRRVEIVIKTNRGQ
jgi:outer membrane protein OmpA-like peptidoglycan-associated protein